MVFGKFESNSALTIIFFRCFYKPIIGFLHRNNKDKCCGFSCFFGEFSKFKNIACFCTDTLNFGEPVGKILKY